MNETELIKALSGHRAGCDGCGYEHNCRKGYCRLMIEAADFINTLKEENHDIRQNSVSIETYRELFNENERLRARECEIVEDNNAKA